MKLRKKLINARKKAELTQLELAKILNVTEQHYQRLEAGTSDGSVKLWQQLAKYFNVTIDYLLEQEGNSKEDLFSLPSEKTSPSENTYRNDSTNRR